ncbi:MAG: hypothetical protein ACKO3I_06125 [Synechococcales cyanobacterium]
MHLALATLTFNPAPSPWWEKELGNEELRGRSLGKDERTKENAIESPLSPQLNQRSPNLEI